jgi:hypothetical protein
MCNSNSYMDCCEMTTTHQRASKTLSSVFFSEQSLRRILTYLCNTRAPGSWDPVTATVLDLLTGKLQFCLSATGLIPFKGHANLVFPYHMMTPDQKDYIRTALQERASYTICNDSVVFHASQGDPERLDPVSVLEAMCSKVLESKVHGEHSVRMGVCNILLQRVQSVVPISRGVQQRLNVVLFGDK